jgi:hypothetical protein
VAHNGETKVAYSIVVKESDGIIPRGRHKLEDDIKMDVKGYGARVWAVHKWLKIGYGGWFHKGEGDLYHVTASNNNLIPGSWLRR